MIKNIKIKPVITEKTSTQMELGKYVFYVSTDINKIDIRKYIETTFNTKVNSINSLKIKGKTVRRGKIYGKKQDRKKVIVTLDPNSNQEKIKEIF